ncbi:prospero homeobox protein 1-like [Antennarius striatus]|uniref:prospero homeobox protein 1-like n=1 Tax=Antennarius striatus TaxID=241820 RepID=UPI0035B1D270
MPDHDSTDLLTRQTTKRRRVDIGVKRTVGSSLLTRARETLLDGMNQSHGADQDGDGEKSNVLRKLLKRANSYEDAIMPFPGATIISQLLKSSVGKNGGSDSSFQGSGNLSSGGSEIQAEDTCSTSSHDDCLSPGPPLPLPPPPSSSSSSSFGRPPPPPLATSDHDFHAPPQPPLPLSSFDLDRLSDEHLRAKRARVENIIRGMSHSPLVRNAAQEAHDHENDGGGGGAASLLGSPGIRGGGGEQYRENKRKQRLPQQQHSFTQMVCSRQEQRLEERRQLKLQLEDMQKQLRQLQEKFYQIYDSETEEEEENGERNRGGREEDGDLSEGSVRSDGLEEGHGGGRRGRDPPDLDPGLFLDRARALLRERALMDGELEEEEEEERRSREGAMKRRGEAGGGRRLAETLKQELNCAVSQVVDTVVKGFSSPKQAAAHLHGCHGSTPVAAPSSSSNSSSSCPPPFGPLPSLTPDSRFGSGGGGLTVSLNGDSSPAPNYHAPAQRLHCFGDVIVPSPLDTFGGLSGRLSGVPPPNDQTEALPLVVRKSSGGGENASLASSLPPPPHPSLHPSHLTASIGFSPPSFRHPFPLPLMGYPFQNPLGSHGAGDGYPPAPKDHHHHRSSPDSLDMSRDTVSLRTKMASLGGGHLGHHHHHHHHHHRQNSPSQQEALSLSLIKSECGDLQDLSDISPYSGGTIQEGLSPNHLKKAKLMFFYTRYPSSNMLKMFFADVKFNRCITSQLIKWFSNFREFYYIQMEKFARQAINEGVTAADDLLVSRDTELFRALNMHYNKANDFEVPDRFLEVAQVTLREFFNAIVAGKDADPSWKKAIYKVICKLDSEVPDVFKSPTCLQELLHD